MFYVFHYFYIAVLVAAAALLTWYIISACYSVLRPTSSVSFVDAPSGLSAGFALSLARYTAGFNSLDVRARACASPDDCRTRYLSSVTSFSAREKRALTALALEVDRSLLSVSQPQGLDLGLDGDLSATARSYVAELLASLGSVRWVFVKLRDDGPDGTLPHTHGEAICLPATFVNRCITAVTVTGTGTGTDAEDVRRTLLHEKIHVLQRARTDLITSFYRDAWGLRPHRKLIDVPHRRNNPDLDEYVYQDMHGRLSGDACVQLYNDLDKPDLRASTPVSLSTRNACRYEHPNEALAYLLSEALYPPRAQSVAARRS